LKSEQSVGALPPKIFDYEGNRLIAPTKSAPTSIATDDHYWSLFILCLCIDYFTLPNTELQWRRESTKKLT